MPFALFPLDRGVSARMDRALGEPSGHGPYLPALARLAALCRGAQKYLAPFAETKAPPATLRTPPATLSNPSATLRTLPATPCTLPATPRTPPATPCRCCS